MARRFEHGAVRTQPPRRKDQTRYTAADRDRNHGASGRFAPGNDAAKRKAIRSLLKRQLGAEASTEEVEQLYREVMVTFRSLLADLPANDSSEVQDLTGRRARWGVLSARFASKAAELGLFTDAGMKLLDVAMKLDARAERLAVTARDEAERVYATRPPKDDDGDDFFSRKAPPALPKGGPDGS